MFDFGLMAQTVQKQEREQPQQGKPAQEKVERFSVLDGLRKYALGKKPEPVLLVGRPGSGKSTTLAKLFLEEALTQKLEFSKNSDFSASIPVLVELRYWQGSLCDLIHNAIARHDPTLKAISLDHLLVNALLLFDGVNELPSEEARSQLAAFRCNHPNLPMIFTTRDLSLGGDLGIERKLEMLPLTEPQMQAFIRAYIPEQAEVMLRQLKERLREFGQTPLLLWMLCEVFQQSPDNQLPSNLGGVFQAFTRMYEESSVRKHEVALLKGDVSPLSDRRLWKKALMAIASIMMQGKTPVDFRVAIHREEAERELSRMFLKETFPVRDILDDLLKYHLLQNCSADQIEFRHQLIQEYYAAEYLLRLLQPPDGKPGLTDEQLKQDYLNYLKWTEPIALMLALVDEEAQALRVVRLAMDEVDLMLGVRLVGKVRREFQVRVVKYVEELNVPSWFKVKLLGRTRSDIAIPNLLKVLKDFNPDVFDEGIDLIDKIFFSKTIPENSRASAFSDFLKLRESSGYPVVENTIEALGNIGSETAVANLFDLLKDPRSEIRSKTADVLGRIGSEPIILSLLKLLESSDYKVLSSAADALGKTGDERATPSLLKLLRDPRTYVLSSAVDALGRIGSKRAIPDLLELLKSHDPEARRKVAYVLGQIGSESTVPDLLGLLEDPELSVFRSAADALGKIGSKSAIPDLLKSLENSDPNVRSRAAEALGKIRNESAVSGLLKLLEDADSEVRWSSVSALGKIASETAFDALLNLLDNSAPEVRSSAAKALGKLGFEIAIPSLLKLLEDSDSDVRSSVANALGAIGSEVAIPNLLKLLEDSDSDVRSSAANALGEIGSEVAVPNLLKPLEGSEPNVCCLAVYALGKIGSEVAIPSLLNLIENSDTNFFGNGAVRSNVVEALGNIGSEKAISSLFSLLKDSELFNEAAYAIAEIAKRYPNEISPYLSHPYSLKLIPNNSSGTLAFQSLYYAVLENCKYYNYELFQNRLAAQKGDCQTQPNSDPNAITIQTLERLTIMTDKSPIFNQQHATIGVNYAAEGSTIEFTQYTNSSEQTFEILLTDYKQFIEQLQQKYPTMTDPTTVPQIIEVESKLIEAQDQHRWQNFLNLKRLWNGGKKAGIKIGEHFAENNVWAKGAIAFLEGVSEDGK